MKIYDEMGCIMNNEIVGRNENDDCER